MVSQLVTLGNYTFGYLRISSDLFANGEKGAFGVVFMKLIQDLNGFSRVWTVVEG
ncbi:hypothetical protein D3C80_1629680 [compost metagenome]